MSETASRFNVLKFVMSIETIHELFVSLESTLRERLRIIENVMIKSLEEQVQPTHNKDALQHAVHALHSAIYEQGKQIHDLKEEIKILKAAPRQPDTSEVGVEAAEAAVELETVMCAALDAADVQEGTKIEVAAKFALAKAVDALNQEAEEEVVEEEEEVVEEEVVEEEEEVVEEEEVEEEEEELVLTEFMYRNKKYYKDTENQVYQEDDDGAVIPEPIGTWNETMKKIQRFA